MCAKGTKRANKTMTGSNILTLIKCEHKKIKYCKECVYYVCMKCGALTTVMDPLKFWNEDK